MKISSEILLLELGKLYDIHYKGKLSSTMELERPFLYTEDIPFKKNKLYVCTAEQLAESGYQKNSGAVILCIGKIPPEKRFAAGKILELPADTGMSVLFNGVQNIFDRYEDDNSFFMQLKSPGELANVIREYLSNMEIGQKKLAKQFEQLGWHSTDEYCCMAIQMGEKSFRGQTLYLVSTQIESILSHCCVFEYEGKVAVFVNLTKSGEDIEAIKQKTTFFFRDNNLRVGISDAFTNLRDLRYCYKQAEIALDFGTRQAAFKWIVFFHEISQNYMLSRCIQELPLHLLCSKEILEMKHYDEVHRTEFYDTLKAYVKNRFNALHAAKELYIHRSTFLYRLKRIQELFQINPDEEEGMFFHILSIELIDTYPERL